jgi:hypothetical protein
MNMLSPNYLADLRFPDSMTLRLSDFYENADFREVPRSELHILEGKGCLNSEEDRQIHPPLITDLSQ